MKKYLFIFFLFIFLLSFTTPGLSKDETLPWKEIMTLSSDPEARRMEIESVYGKDKYLFINYWSTKDEDTSIKKRDYNILLVDLNNGKRLYEKSHINGKKVVYVRIDKGFLIYVLQDIESNQVTVYKVDLAIGRVSSRDFPKYVGFMDYKTRAQNLYLWDFLHQKIYLYDPIKEELTYYTISDRLRYPGTLFDEHLLIYEVDGILKIEDLKTHDVSIVAKGKNKYLAPGPTFIRNTPIFPLFVQNEEDKWELRIYNDLRKPIKIYRLSQLKINKIDGNTKFYQFGNYNGFSVFYISDKDSNSSHIRTYLLFDKDGNLLRIIKKRSDFYDYPEFFEGKDGKIYALFHKDSSSWELFSKNKHYLLKGYDISEERVKISENALLIGGDKDNIIKFSLDTKTLTGLYIFPANEDLLLSHVHNNYVYVLLYHESPSYIKLISFPLISSGWLFSKIEKISPTTPRGLKVYEDTDTKVIISPPSSSYIGYSNWGGLKVSVDKGSIKKYLDYYIWHTPHLDAPGEEDANIVLSLGPIKERYSVKVVRPDNPIKIDLSGITKVEATDCYEGKLCYEIKIPFVNHANIEIKDLKWQIDIKDLKTKSMNINTFSHIQAGDKHYVKVIGRIYPEEEDVKWDGYMIHPQITVKLDYKWGHIEYKVQGEVTIKPEYSFYAELPGYNLQIEKMKIFTQDGTDITNRLKITLKDVHTAKIEGVSPGFPGKPLKLNILYGGKNNPIELSFGNRCDIFPFGSSYAPKFILKKVVVQKPTPVPTRPTKTILRVNVTTKRGPLTDCNIEIKNDKKTYKKPEIEEIKPGRWTVKVWKKGYIPFKTEITVIKNRENIVNVELKPFVGIIFEVNSYYKSMFTDVKEAGIINTPNLTSITDNIFILPEGYDEVYFDMIYKVGYPDTYVAALFGEDTYKASCKVEKDGTYVFSKNIRRGKKSEKTIEEYSEDDIYKDPKHLYSYKIEKPTMFKVTLVAKADKTKKECFIIWVFPSEWKNHKKAIEEGLIIYGYKGNNLDTLFQFPYDARAYLRNGANTYLTTSALNDIVWYGMKSLDFLRGALGIPDFGLLSLVQDGINRYIDYTLDKRMVELFAMTDAEPDTPELKRIKEVKGSIRVSLVGSVAGEMYGIMDTIKSAGEWAEGISAVINEGIARVIAGAMLESLGNSHNFSCIIEEINSLKDPIKEIIKAFEENKPQNIEDKIQDIKSWVIGTMSDYDSNDCKTYSIMDRFALEFLNIKEWKSGRSWAPISEDYVSYPNEDKYRASKKAMEIYEPIIKRLFYIIAPVIDACIIEVQEQN